MRAGTRHFIRVLQLLAHHPVDRVKQALVRCQNSGAVEVAVITAHVEQLAAHGPQPVTPPPAVPPVPRLAGPEELNDHLRRCCLAERDLISGDHTEAVGARFERERAAALPSPARPFDACVLHPAQVDKYQTARFDGNAYSVPRRWAFRPVTVKGYVDRIAIVAEGQVVACHARCYGKGERVLQIRLQVFHHHVERRVPGVLFGLLIDADSHRYRFSIRGEREALHESTVGCPGRRTLCRVREYLGVPVGLHHTRKQSRTSVLARLDQSARNRQWSAPARMLRLYTIHPVGGHALAVDLGLRALGREPVRAGRAGAGEA